MQDFQAFRLEGTGVKGIYVVCPVAFFGREPLAVCAPLFREKFDAQVFAAVYGLRPGLFETPEDEERIAKEIAEFVVQWNAAHGDDDRYPTPDGQYPKPKWMAERFLESRPKAQVAA